MSSTATNFFNYPSGADDPLELLPHTPLREYQKNELLYDFQDRAEHLYLVIDGRVKVARQPEGGREVVLDFYSKDNFFGEAAFLGAEHYGEQAVALDKTSVMAWSVADLRRLMSRTPALGSALLRVVAGKLSDANERIESLCLDPIHKRLIKTLLRLGDRFGQADEQQMMHLLPVTHEHLARYVGTSREIVTQYMNQFRRDHLLRYSRRGVDLDVPALKQYLAKAS
jgi:CRP/FNR family transcriptional regulator